MSAFSLNWCADFSMLCTKIILIDFGFNQAIDGLKHEWDKIKLERTLSILEITGWLTDKI